MGHVTGARRRMDSVTSDGGDAIEHVATATVTTGDRDYATSFPGLWRRAYSVAYQLLGSRAAAEDAAQETMARAYSWWPRISGPPGGWVARVASTVAVDQVRRRPVIGGELSDAAGTLADPTADPMRSERLDLQRSLAGLPRRQREVVVLRYLADQSEADTAAALGLSVSTVRKHAARGLTALRIDLTPRPEEG